MKKEEANNQSCQTTATTAIALLLGVFILTTMGFSSSLYRNSVRDLDQPSVNVQGTTLLENREVFVGVDSSFAAYQNAIQH